MNKLHGKRALVTAGAQGIGLAISRQLLASGCDVFVHYRSTADAARGLEAEAEALGRRYAHAAADLTESLECDRLVGEAVKFLGTSFHNTHTTPESAKATVAGIPLGRGGNADDVARAAVFLAGEYDGFITGATLDINGGVYAC